MALTSPRFARDDRLKSASSNKPAMNWGEMGEPVRIVQQALLDLGYSMPISTRLHGSPDGIFGDETKATVKSFQGKYGLTVDGIVGAGTLSKLDQLLPGAGTTLSPLSASDFIKYKFRVVFRSIAMPVVPESVALNFARLAYARYGFRIDEGAGMSLMMNPGETVTLDTVDGACDWDEESAEQTQLFALGGGRAGVGNTDILVYYVNDIKQTDGSGLDGCAGHKPGAPAAVVAASATKYAMAHEVGHNLLGSRFVPVHTTSLNNLMYEGYLGDLTADPPGLTENQVRAIRSSVLVSGV